MGHRHTRWITGAGILFGLAALTAARPARPEPFTLVLVREGTSWSATCEAGCAWETVASSRPRILGTSVVIDSRGIYGSGPGDAQATFAFRATADGANGWKATGLKGTAWKALTFQCATSPCRARISESGVEGGR